MNIVIRTDASVNTGAGHVMRCLALSDELRRFDTNIFYICREDLGNSIALIEEKGYKVYRLPCNDLRFETEIEKVKSALMDIGNVDLLIVDHYESDKQWEKQMRVYVKRLLVIDDLADRYHDCDILLNQNFYEGFKTRYDGMVPEHCQKLLGPQYALLRQEFTEARKKLRKRNGDIRRLLVFFGSSDPTNETAKALSALKLFNNRFSVDVVVGDNNPQREMIKDMCGVMPGVEYYCPAYNMAELMVNADLSIGSGGSTTWERCCLGLPALVAVLSDNQYELTLAVGKYGALISLGWGHSLVPEDYSDAINNISARHLCEMSAKGLSLVDGEGCPRVARKIFSILG
jgi:UDP-2,4-diacetamido-2,4,6-trideoxy-beta-L-altropyranose hydrolase